jgi:hypothetical protein
LRILACGYLDTWAFGHSLGYLDIWAFRH